MCILVDCRAAIIVRSSEEMCVDFGILVDLHFHLEGVELFFDLLSKHWSQAVACCNFTPTVVLAARPGIVELDPRTECSISFVG